MDLDLGRRPATGRVREVPAECGAAKPDAFDSEQQGVYVGSLDSKEVKRWLAARPVNMARATCFSCGTIL